MAVLTAIDPCDEGGFNLDEGHQETSACHPLVCPHCWELIGVWLGSPVATCVACQRRFTVAKGDP